VIVPLLCFDRRGHRVGYGKGFYDRYLQKCRPDCIKAGLSFFDPVDLIDDTYADDIPLDICVTPSETFRFN
jgi:5-formyltetrahydrofolate cyclo-ligase